MSSEVIWVHEKALNGSALSSLKPNAPAIFIWDEQYFKSRCYALKRLVFIYESLCEIEIKVYKGNTLEVLNSLNPEKITTFFIPDSKISELIDQVSQKFDVDVIKPKPFVNLPEKYSSKRFFTYWNKAKKSAFMVDGGFNA